MLIGRGSARIYEAPLIKQRVRRPHQHCLLVWFVPKVELLQVVEERTTLCATPRLISYISYEMGTVTVLAVLTHKEYDKARWKSACNC
ncbi:MAG: hypothetical protein C5B58_00745 [Acidobacteria bacterium]|nr:MAG: hypothetical protein C5B58_00745 [Acidobacteriota bacterium]